MHVHVHGCRCLSTCTCLTIVKTSAQTFNGFCLYCVDLTVLRPWFDTHHNAVKLQPCARIAVCSFDGQPAVIGLTERFRLFVNNIQVVPAAGSKPLLRVAVQSCEVMLFLSACDQLHFVRGARRLLPADHPLAHHPLHQQTNQARRCVALHVYNNPSTR